MAEKWIAKATEKHKGAFGREAKEHGMSTAGFAKHVMSHPDAYSGTVVKRASLAKTLRGITNKLKKNG